MALKTLFQMIGVYLGIKPTVSAAREIGVTVGNNCKILCNPYNSFGTEPYLVSIGDNVEITSGCQFITHDGSVWVARSDEQFREIDVFGRIIIGNNVFIGVNSIVLPGVSIGDNVIIAAGSVVSKSIPSNQVWGGVPCRFIKTIEEYKVGVLEKGDYTHSMNASEKKNEIKKNHPEWFEKSR